MRGFIEELIAYIVFLVGAFVAMPLLVLSLERVA